VLQAGAMAACLRGDAEEPDDPATLKAEAATTGGPHKRRDEIIAAWAARERGTHEP